MVTNAITKIIGAQVLQDMKAFVAAFDTLFGGFRQRAQRTFELLQDRRTAFLVVAAPEPDALREAAYFVERLRAGADAAGRAGRQPGEQQARGRPVRRRGDDRRRAAAHARARTTAWRPGCSGCTPTGCASSSARSG